MQAEIGEVERKCYELLYGLIAELDSRLDRRLVVTFLRDINEPAAVPVTAADHLLDARTYLIGGGSPCIFYLPNHSLS